jgi:hypothetical protein
LLKNCYFQEKTAVVKCCSSHFDPKRIFSNPTILEKYLFNSDYSILMYTYTLFYPGICNINNKKIKYHYRKAKNHIETKSKNLLSITNISNDCCVDSIIFRKLSRKWNLSFNIHFCRKCHKQPILLYYIHLSKWFSFVCISN